MGKLGLSRRGFLKASALAGVSVFIAPLGSRAFAALFEEKILTPVQWDATSGGAKFRIDGIAKVTGAKVFARDIRAADMPHWPQDAVARADPAHDARRPHLRGLRSLDARRRPRRPTASSRPTISRATSSRSPPSMATTCCCPPARRRRISGQAVAILIYHDFARFRFAKDKLQFRDGVIRYGATTGPLERDPWAAFRFVRVGGKTPYDDDTFSSLKDTPLFPHMMKKREPVWASAAEHGKLDEQGMFHANAIADALDHPPARLARGGPRILARNPSTRPRSNPTTRTAGTTRRRSRCTWSCPTQGPHRSGRSAIEMTAKSRFAVKNLFLHPCYTVGYGSKDHYNLPFYGLRRVAVRRWPSGAPRQRSLRAVPDLAQAARVRHAATAWRSTGRSGLIQVVQGRLRRRTAAGAATSRHRSRWSARRRRSPSTTSRRAISTAIAIASRAVDAGSARGYGTLQSMGATEMMIDEIAAAARHSIRSNSA